MMNLRGSSLMTIKVGEDSDISSQISTDITSNIIMRVRKLYEFMLIVLKKGNINITESKLLKLL